MKKKMFGAVLAILVLSMALVACGGNSKTDSIKTAYTDAGYTVDAGDAYEGALEMFGAMKGNIMVAVYKFDKKESADAFKTIMALTESTGAKVSVKDSVYACYAMGGNASENAAAVEIFNKCF